MSLRTPGLTVILASLALSAAACGDDGETAATTSTADTTTTAGAPAKPTTQRRELERHIRAALLADGEPKAVDVGCAIDELRQTLSNSAVEDAIAAIERGGEVPRAAIDAAFEAGKRCRAAGGAGG